MSSTGAGQKEGIAPKEWKAGCRGWHIGLHWEQQRGIVLLVNIWEIAFFLLQDSRMRDGINDGMPDAMLGIAMKRQLCPFASSVPKMIFTVGLLVIFAGGYARAQITNMPPSQVIDWQNWGIGVPSSITTNRSIIFTNLSAGVSAAQISAVLAACPSNQVVFLNAGTYNLSGSITFNNNYVTLRGAGMGQTVLQPSSVSGNGGVINMGTGVWPRPSASIAITSGATNGSTTVTVGDASSVPVGYLIRIEQQNLPWVRAVTGYSQTNFMSFVFLCTNKTATTVSFMPALPFTLTNSPALAYYPSYILKGSGVENCTFNLSNSTSAACSVFLVQAYGCWLKNVEVEGSSSRQIWLDWVANCEISGCYTHDVLAGGPNHEGVDLNQDCCWNLIQNNQFVKGGFPQLVLGDASGGCAGNIIAYNFSYKQDTFQSASQCDLDISHGPHNMFNLCEGNIASGFMADSYYGSSSHNTVYRNWLTANGQPYTNGYWAVLLDRWNYYYNVVGNILGDTSFPVSGNGTFTTQLSNYAFLLNGIIRLGYPDMGGSSYTCTSPPCTDQEALDTYVISNTFTHANYDYYTHSVIYSNGWSHSLTNSLYLTGKPSWFGALPWPPFDPNNPGAANVTNIPSGYRYVYGANPPPAATSPPAAPSALMVTAP